MKTALVIGLGGAIGAMLRHFTNTGISHLFRGSFPLGIMAVNVIGCFIMGVLVAVFAAAWNPPQEIRAFLTVGILGGFTTFSSFSLDAMNLWSSGDAKGAFLYVTGSVVLSLAAVFSGSALVWKFVG